MEYFYQIGFCSDYPNYYSGSYIGDDYKFHVRLCLPTADELHTLNTIFCEYSDVIVYEYGNFSRNEMLEYSDDLANELIDLGYGITSWGVDDLTGSVSIGVLNEDLNEVTSLIDRQETYAMGDRFPNIILKEGNYSQAASVTNPGTSDGNIRFSAYGYYNGEKAIVTCGHGGHQVGSSFSFGDISGSYVVRQYQDEETGDYAIGLINRDVTLSHKVGNSGIVLNGFAYSPVVGSTIKVYKKDGTIAKGTVTEVDKRIQRLSGESSQLYIHLLGMTEVRITSGSIVNGDSGGPCLTYVDAFCGVLSGFSTLDNSANYFHYTPNRTLRNLGFYVYADSHDNLSWKPLNADSHYAYCSGCQQTRYESHGEYWDETTTPYCTRCGYVG